MSAIRKSPEGMTIAERFGIEDPPATPAQPPVSDKRCAHCGGLGPDHRSTHSSLFDCVDELKRQVANGARIIRDLTAELRASAPAYADDGDRRASPSPGTPAERLASARAAACDLAVAAGVLLIECEELAAIPGEHVAGADALRRVAVIITDEVAIALPRGGS